MIEVHVVKHEFGQSYAQLRAGPKSDWVYMQNPPDFVHLGDTLNALGFVNRPTRDYPGVLVFEYTGEASPQALIAAFSKPVMMFDSPLEGWIEADFEPSFVRLLTN